MKVRIPLYIFIITVALYGCSTAKQATTAVQLDQLDQLVAARSFTFTADWSMPLATNSLNQLANAGLLPMGNNASQINLLGNPNHLTFKKDSVMADLPYYGERQFGAGYNTDRKSVV